MERRFIRFALFMFAMFCIVWVIAIDPLPIIFDDVVASMLAFWAMKKRKSLKS